MLRCSYCDGLPHASAVELAREAARAGWDDKRGPGRGARRGRLAYRAGGSMAVGSGVASFGGKRAGASTQAWQ
jgi:hypothetical protein